MKHRLPQHTSNRRARHKSEIYFVESKLAGVIKIGITNDLDKRLMGLRCDSPTPLDVLLVIPGTARDEHALHILFDADRSHGEWFHGTIALRSFIDGIRHLSPRQLAQRLRHMPAPPRSRTDNMRGTLGLPWKVAA